MSTTTALKTGLADDLSGLLSELEAMEQVGQQGVNS